MVHEVNGCFVSPEYSLIPGLPIQVLITSVLAVCLGMYCKRSKTTRWEDLGTRLYSYMIGMSWDILVHDAQLELFAGFKSYLRSEV